MVLAGESEVDSFMRAMPDAIGAAATIRMTLACSPSITTPTANAPMASVPVQIV